MAFHFYFPEKKVLIKQNCFGKNIRLIILKLRWKLIKLARKYGVNLKIALHIPSAFVTGSVGKTTTCRMLAAILAENRTVVGLSTTQGVYVGKETIRVGDSSNCWFASQLLIDKRVQAGVFELARGGLLEQGIVFNGCDVGAILNIYDNHLGLGGIHTREGMAKVKSAVVKSARKMVVINADDPLCLAMRDQVVAAQTCLVSMLADNPIIIDHMKAKGVAAFLDSKQNPVLNLYRGNELIGAIPAAEIPASYDAAFRPALFSALFATALAYGMGVEFTVIRNALRVFQSDAETNPGRMNFYDHLPFKVLITWVDGPQAAEELARFIQKMNCTGKKYLMFCSVGNRPDQYIKDMGKSVRGSFTHYICSDHVDLRGKPPGETAALLGEGLLDSGVSRENITIASSHQNALKLVLKKPSTHDLLVICTFASDAARKEVLLKNF